MFLHPVGCDSIRLLEKKISTFFSIFDFEKEQRRKKLIIILRFFSLFDSLIYPFLLWFFAVFLFDLF